MISYYAYYNHGGYKDFFLGTSDDTVESRYFLPLLNVYEDDESMRDKVDELRKLPSIIFLSNHTVDLNYPSQARVMMSHAGYKIQYRKIENKDVLALRDIEGNKDTFGRSCPFVMMFVADTDEDKECLETIAFYIWNHLQDSEAFFNSLFVSDFNVNGLRFDIKHLNDFLEMVLSLQEGKIEENKYSKQVPFYVVPEGFGRFDKALAEQQLSKEDVAVAYNESKTLVYRYTPQQFCYGGPGVPPIVVDMPEEEHVDEKPQLEPKRSSLLSMFGILKEEDLKELQYKVDKLEKDVAELQKRIMEIENK